MDNPTTMGTMSMTIIMAKRGGAIKCLGVQRKKEISALTVLEETVL